MSEVWEMHRLEMLTSKVGSGATPKGGREAYKVTGIPLIRSMNVVFFGFKREGLAFIDDSQAAELANVAVEPDDVLLNITGASIGRVTLAPADLVGARVNQHVCIIRPTAALNARFLRAYLSGPGMQDLIWADNFGVTRQALTKQQILDFKIPVPPLSEQVRIVDQLDTLLARVQACNDHFDAIPGLVKRLRQAVLNSAAAGTLTEDWRQDGLSPWRTVQLHEVASDFSYGSAAKSAGGGMVPVLRMGNIQGGRLDWSDLVYTSDLKEINKYRLAKGDVLFNRTNSPELVGKTAVFQGERDAIYAGYLIRVRCLPALLPEYLNYCLGSRLGRDYCWSVKSDGVSQSNINAKKLAAFRFLLPSVEEQREIVRRVEALFEVADRIEARYAAAHAKAQRLTALLLAKAFRGELAPQDPNDESAGAMLARIAAQRGLTATPTKARQLRKPRAAHAPTETTTMKKSRLDDDVMGHAYLASQLRRMGGSASAEALFKAADLPVADFYKQLAWEVAQGHVKDSQTLLEPRDAA